MLVCLCKIVSEREVRSAIHRGAHSIAEIGLACGAGTDCGLCRETIAQMLREEGVDAPGPPLTPAAGRSVSTDPSHPAADSIRKERRS